MKRYSYRVFLRGLVFAALLASFVPAVSGCAGGEIVVKENPKPPPPPVLRVPSPQEAVYNGEPQPLSFYYEGEAEPRLVYYPSAEARNNNRDGLSAPPVGAGSYYVRVSLSGKEVLAEYRILKAPVKIKAAEIQQAFYNGNPRRVEAKAEPPVTLYYSYYPNPELRDAARKATEEALADKDSGQSLAEVFRGYKRVERAPIEQGTYFVWIYFPGDENHETAEASVEFTILPALLNN